METFQYLNNCCDSWKNTCSVQLLTLFFKNSPPLFNNRKTFLQISRHGCCCLRFVFKAHSNIRTLCYNLWSNFSSKLIYLSIYLIASTKRQITNRFVNLLIEKWQKVIKIPNNCQLTGAVLQFLKFFSYLNCRDIHWEAIFFH